MENARSVALHQYLRSVITNIPFGIITVANDLDVVMLNSIVLSLLGFDNKDPEEFVDNPYTHIFKYVSKIQEEFEQEILIKKERKFNILKFSFNHKVLNIKCRATLHGTLFIIEDITHQAKLEEDLIHKANYDILTDLINRQEFEKRVDSFGKRTSDSNLAGAIVFIDLDRFKPVNDLAGHSAGDALLKKVSEFMKKAIRRKDTLARVGGDEFIILLENCSLAQAVKITEKIRKEIDDYIFTWNEHSFSIGISAGISTITNKLENFNEAINSADQACLIAKNEGRNRIHIADDAENESRQHKEEVSWINIINKGLKNDEFVLFKQKIHAIGQTEKLGHYELLLRLKNDAGELLSPAAFMPAAERYELMLKIDEWVVKTAFKSVSNGIHYSINLSGQTMSNPDFPNYVISMEKEFNMNPTCITFEITETMAIKYFKVTQKTITILSKRGYTFSLDDFGTGLSSYEYLKKMSVAYLKIDGMFIKDIVVDKVSYTMVKSINEIGKVMGLKTIAEFVENEKILQVLQEIGVDYAQGYHIHKPEAL